MFTLTVLMETFIGQMIQFLDVHMKFIVRTDKNHTQEVGSFLVLRTTSSALFERTLIVLEVGGPSVLFNVRSNKVRQESYIEYYIKI